MELAPPADFADYLADATAIAGVARTRWRANLGAISTQLAQGPAPDNTTPDAPVDLVFSRRKGVALHATGTRLAEVNNTGWHWLTAREGGFPELHGTQPAADFLVDAAGLLADGRPITLIPREGSTMVVAVNTSAPTGPVRAAELIEALARLPEIARHRTQRAATAFASAFNLRINPLPNDSLALAYPGATRPLATLLNENQVLPGDHPAPRVFDVLADAWYLSAEHQQLFHSRFPDPQVRFDLRQSLAYFHQTKAALKVLATFTATTLTWAWADPNLPCPSAAAEQLRAFGYDSGILDLLRPSIPLARTHELDVAVLAKPVVSSWTHLVAPVAEGVWALGLIDHPDLRLPPATEESIALTIAEDPPAMVSAERARRAYRAARQ